MSEASNSQNLEAPKPQPDERDAELQRCHEQILNNRKDLAGSLLTLIDMQNTALSGHCRRVSRWAREMGALCDLSPDDLNELEFAGALHDIGLMAIPFKSEQGLQPLKTQEERFTRHPAIGYSLLSRMSGFGNIADAILHHHEKFDGSGYPHKLWGDRIPLFSRIIAVADLYDIELHQFGAAMATTDSEDARRAVIRERGKILDPDLANKFLFLLTTSETAHRDREREVEITPGALRPSMVLSRDLRTVEKVLLLKAGTFLTDEIIDRLFASDKGDWLVAQVYVDASSVRDSERPVEQRRDEKALGLGVQRIQEAPPAQRFEILVVDDSLAVCSALRRELGLVGMQVTGVTSVAAAMEAMRKQKFDALITDLVISGSSGFELLRGSMKLSPHLFAVVLSGFPTADNIKALREFDQVVRFVTKPWQSDVLFAALREAIDRGQNAKARGVA
ncbi:MAG: HD domain-containing phosphohydrolase [Lentisphaerota bacterium]